MDPDLRARILDRLDEISDPCSVAGGTPMGLSEMGLVAAVEIDRSGQVTIRLRLTSPFCHMIAFMQSEATQRVGELDGVHGVRVSADQGLDWSPELIDPPARARRERVLAQRYAGRDPMNSADDPHPRDGSRVL